MKALVLAAGRGKRLGNLTELSNKCMLEFANKPVLEYNLIRAAEIESISEIVLLVGHRAEDIINTYGTSFRGKKIKYAIQWTQKGLVDAIYQAKNALDGDDFFLLLGDEILINSRHKEMFIKFRDEGLFGICGVTFQPDKSKISRTYTVLVDENDRIFRLVEKPKVALTNWQGTGHCIFKNGIFDFIEQTPIHPERGEKELPDLIQSSIDNGKLVKIFNICDRYTNINCQTDLDEIKDYL